MSKDRCPKCKGKLKIFGEGKNKFLVCEDCGLDINDWQEEKNKQETK